MNKYSNPNSSRENSYEYPNLNLLPKLDKTAYSKWNKTSLKFMTKNKSPTILNKK